MPKTRSLTPRMISEFCRLRLKSVLVDGEIELMANYLVGLLEIMAYPPYRGSGIDWTSLADVTGIEVERLKAARLQIKPVLDAVARSVGVQERDAPLRPESNQEPSTHKRSAPKERARRGPAPKSIVEFPEPLFTEWDDPAEFRTALDLHMRRHGDSVRHLYLSLAARGAAQDQRTLMKWCTGQLLPMTARSFVVLNEIERRYRLPLGYFKAKLPHQARAIRGVTMSGMPTHERRRLAWHLPDDFLTRPKDEQEEILEWVRRVIITGSTDYRRYQAAAMKHRYAVRFSAFQKGHRYADLTVLIVARN